MRSVAVKCVVALTLVVGGAVGTSAVPNAGATGGTVLRGYLASFYAYVRPLGTAPDVHHDWTGVSLNEPMIAIAEPPVGPGYWLAALDGGVFAIGGARFYGSLASQRLNKPIVGITPTPTGRGYWLVASDGGVFSFGDARFFGSLAGHHLNAPIATIAETPTGQGYWLLGSDGGVFAFGDARYKGSLGGTKVVTPISTMGVTPSGHGYWLLDRLNQVTAFGDAPNLGSSTNNHNSWAVGLVRTPSGNGYWIASTDSGIAAFGDALLPTNAPGSSPGGGQVIGLGTPWASSSGYGLMLIEAHQQGRWQPPVWSPPPAP